MHKMYWTYGYGGGAFMYGQEESLREQIVNEYRADLEKLLRYLPYLDKKKGKDVQNFYEGDGSFTVIPVPVYDSTLLAFVKEAKKTKFMNKFYPYTYRRHRMTTPADERAVIEKCVLRDIDVIRGILSKYILEGQRKSVMWTLGVEERIYVTALEKMRSLFAEYDAEMAKKGI